MGPHRRIGPRRRLGQYAAQAYETAKACMEQQTAQAYGTAQACGALTEQACGVGRRRQHRRVGPRKEREGS